MESERRIWQDDGIATRHCTVLDLDLECHRLMDHEQRIGRVTSSHLAFGKCLLATR